MGTTASQITGVSIMYSTVCTDADEKKNHKGSALLALCEGTSLVAGEFPAQRASNAEKHFYLVTSSWFINKYHIVGIGSPIISPITSL